MLFEHVLKFAPPAMECCILFCRLLVSLYLYNFKITNRLLRINQRMVYKLN